ncbi:hypothetical protein K6W16_13615 [Burkholderia dolosa]|uniref:Uncharacterized protein n=1 Tax=Burkholderia dolosa TaxID=152500 RepID=A0A892HWK2_9BURK|nr:MULTISPECIES: hypothetical protein [Burkholderia]AJY12793.1 hypothetical protein AK34_1587 [Burkholderia dolosa AU0158]EAY68961.1 hypothetical protein BDAG_01699 [Burkholderia dolosa AU0158]MBR8418976.1 hypothetical protein [Burkholderia dolosa]MBY4658505.1 hypothetical protein [Burkholderia dolosa]MBY4689129.1 hypothetical protein [Burkholderia dolosa]
MTTKAERAEHANQLLRAIGSHGRRFFYNAKHDQYARFELDSRGRVWFVDDYTQKRVYTHDKGRWRGFTQGGTLRSLVERMRDYIRTGWQLPRGVIAPPYMGGNSEDNVWGYDREAAAALRATAFELPIMAPPPWPSDTPRDYYVISVHHTMRENKFITLWCPDDSGYCFRTTRAGKYKGEAVRTKLGYYNSGCANIAVPVDVIDPLTVMTTPADRLDGPDGPALLNTRANWKKLIANVIARPEYPIEPQFPGARRPAHERRRAA